MQQKHPALASVADASIALIEIRNTHDIPEYAGCDHESMSAHKIERARIVLHTSDVLVGSYMVGKLHVSS